MRFHNANSIGIIFIFLHMVVCSSYAVPIEQRFYFDVEEVRLMQESRRPLALLGQEGISFFQQFQHLLKQGTKDDRHKDFSKLCDSVASGQRIIALDDALKIMYFVQNSCADKHLKQKAHSLFSNFKVAKVVIEGTELPCELFLCHDVDSRVSGGQHTFQKPFQSVAASLTPKQRRLLIGTLFVSDYVCIEGDAAFARPVDFLDDVRIAEGKKLYVDKLAVRTCNAPFQFASDLCIDEKYKLFVNTIKPKTTDGAVRVLGDLEVCCNSDLIVNGRLIIPGELVVSSTGDVLIKDGNCLYVNCINAIDTNGTTTIGNLGVSDGKQLLVNKIVPIDTFSAPNPSDATLFCGSVCIESHATLSVDTIEPKTSQGRIAQGHTTLESAIVTQGVAVGTSVTVDRIDPRMQNATSFRSICIDAGMTLSVDSIEPKTSNGSISIPRLTLNSANITGDISVTGSVQVGDSIHVDRIEPQSGAATQFVSVCIDPGMTLSVDKICAKTMNEPIEFCSDICVEAGNKISTNLIESKTGLAVTFSADLIVTGSVSADVVSPRTTSSLFVNGDVNIPAGRSYLVDGIPFSAGFANPAVAGLNMNFNDIINANEFEGANLLIRPQIGTLTSPSFSVSSGTGIAVFTDMTIILDNSFIVPSSDERIKENITPINSDNSLAQILQLEPVTYSFKKKNENKAEGNLRTQHGFIAQQVKNIFPDMVHIRKGFGRDGEEIDDFHYLEYNSLIAEIIAAMQAMHEKLKQAEQEIGYLKQQIPLHGH